MWLNARKNINLTIREAATWSKNIYRSKYELGIILYALRMSERNDKQQ